MKTDDEDAEPRKICEYERQSFIDCMFVNSKCVQSGRRSFEECLREHDEHSRTGQGEPFPSDCGQSFYLYIKCRRQIVWIN